MKRFILLSALILCTSLTAFTQENRNFAVGLGLEWNMNAPENFAGGAVLGLDYRFMESFAAGFHFTFSTNFDGIAVMEPAALFRWYFLGPFFVQGDLGAFIVFDLGEMDVRFLGGLRAGMRIPLGEMFYVEPYGRLGYPFMFGIGAIAGVKF